MAPHSLPLSLLARGMNARVTQLGWMTGRKHSQYHFYLCISDSLLIRQVNVKRVKKCTWVEQWSEESGSKREKMRTIFDKIRPLFRPFSYFILYTWWKFCACIRFLFSAIFGRTKWNENPNECEMKWMWFLFMPVSFALCHSVWLRWLWCVRSLGRSYVRLNVYKWLCVRSLVCALLLLLLKLKQPLK